MALATSYEIQNQLEIQQNILYIVLLNNFLSDFIFFAHNSLYIYIYTHTQTHTHTVSAIDKYTLSFFS